MVSTNKPNVLLRKSVITRCLDHTHLALTRCSSWAAKLNIQYLFSRWDRGMCLMLVQSVRFLPFHFEQPKPIVCMRIFFRWNFRSLFLCQLFAFFSCSPYLCEPLFFAWFFPSFWLCSGCVAAQMYICAWLDEIQLNFQTHWWIVSHFACEIATILWRTWKKNLKNNLSEWAREEGGEREVVPVENIPNVCLLFRLLCWLAWYFDVHSIGIYLCLATW